ncbi:hypothetical protein FRC10_003066 [Ceratobasidium sp. 414]|nr:hypothetical protein FRC10_003066 [Ceratobasidium sp. 414]
MAATNDNPIIFWDIAGADGQYWAPNPYKTRLTLNYKGLPYRVKYIKFEEVELTMKAMGIAPTSKTFPYYTLPMITDPSSDPNGEPTHVSESFKIAMYLDEKYPAPKYPAVLPIETRSLQKLFVESYFPTIISHMFPLIAPHIFKLIDKTSGEYLYLSRGGEATFAPLSDADAAQRLAEVGEKLDTFAQALELNGGPWVMGDTVTFADFVVGCILYFWHEVDGDEGKIWKEVAGWQNGKWAVIRERIEAIEKKSTGLA